MRKYPDRLGKNNKTFIGCFLNSYQIFRWLGLPPRPISAPNERYIWHKARECSISVQYKSIVVLNYYKLEMKVWEMKITTYHFVSCFINVTDLSVDVACQVPKYAPSCLSVNFLFASPLTFVYTLIIGLLDWLTFNLDTSKKYDYYIWISEWQKCKLKNGLITHVCKWRKPSFTASTTSPRMLFDAKPWLKSTCCRFEFHLRKKNRARKMHSPQSGRYDHVTSEIWLVCQTELVEFCVPSEIHTSNTRFKQINENIKVKVYAPMFWEPVYKISYP